MKLVSGDFRYELEEGWGRGLADWEDSQWGMRKVVGLGSDKIGNVYILTRSDYPIIEADRNGKLIRRWGKEYFDCPHGATLDEQGNLFCVDFVGHMVHKFSPERKLLMTLGKRGVPSDTGATFLPGEAAPDYRTVRRAAGPFNAPNNLAIARNGDLYIADGYGNARVHRFSAKGEYIQSWGQPGSLPGQFHMPHGIMVGPNDVVYVADRENDRVQLFDLWGNYLTKWDFVVRPSHLILGPDGLVYICECKRTNVFDGYPSSIRIVTLEGEQVAYFDNDMGYVPRKQYRAAHAICVDDEGSIYIGDVGAVPEDHFGLYKFRRI